MVIIGDLTVSLNGKLFMSGQTGCHLSRSRVKMGVKKLLVKGKAVRCTLKYLIGRIEEQEFGDWKIRAAVCSREIISHSNPRARIHQNQNVLTMTLNDLIRKRLTNQTKCFEGCDFDQTNYFLDKKINSKCLHF